MYLRKGIYQCILGYDPATYLHVFHLHFFQPFHDELKTKCPRLECVIIERPQRRCYQGSGHAQSTLLII